MKKLLFILFFPLFCNSQIPFPVDTTPQFRFMFYGDSNNFVNTEYLVRTKLIEAGGIMKVWCYPLCDSLKTVYLAETPSPDRFMNFPELAEIRNDIIDFALGKITLFELKVITQNSGIKQEYKELIYSMMYVNVRKYKLNSNFKNFMP